MRYLLIFLICVEVIGAMSINDIVLVKRMPLFRWSRSGTKSGLTDSSLNINTKAELDVEPMAYTKAATNAATEAATKAHTTTVAASKTTNEAKSTTADATTSETGSATVSASKTASDSASASAAASSDAAAISRVNSLSCDSSYDTKLGVLVSQKYGYTIHGIMRNRNKDSNQPLKAAAAAKGESYVKSSVRSKWKSSGPGKSLALYEVKKHLQNFPNLDRACYTTGSTTSKAKSKSTSTSSTNQLEIDYARVKDFMQIMNDLGGEIVASNPYSKFTYNKLYSRYCVAKASKLKTGSYVSTVHKCTNGMNLNEIQYNVKVLKTSGTFVTSSTPKSTTPDSSNKCSGTNVCWGTNCGTAVADCPY